LAVPQHDPARAPVEFRVIAQVIAPAWDGHRLGASGLDRAYGGGCVPVDSWRATLVHRDGRPVLLTRSSTRHTL
jgi:hypothetical protein